MAKMKTLMADDEEPTQQRAAPEGGTPAERRAEEAGERAEDNPVGLMSEHDLLRELTRPCEEPVSRTDTRAAYIGFASSRSATWELLRQLHAKIVEGIPFVGLPENQFELADPLRFHLVRFRQFWSVRDDSYHLARVEFHDPGRQSDLKEEFHTLTVVHLGRRLVPAVSYFGGTKAGAVRQAADTLGTAGTPGWSERGPAYAAGAKCPLPFGRFLAEVTIEPRTSRTTGRPYQLAVGHVRPTNLEELDLLMEAVQDRDFLGQLRTAMEVFQLRLRNLEEIARGDAA